MTRDYYTKEEVLILLRKLKKKIIEEVSADGSQKEIGGFDLKIRFDEYDDYSSLYDGLFENELILGPKNAFQKVISEGLCAKAHGIEWIANKNLCIYLFDTLVYYEYIEPKNMMKKIENIFGIKHGYKIRSKYKENKSSFPRGYQKVEQALKPLFNIRIDSNIDDAQMEDLFESGYFDEK